MPGNELGLAMALRSAGDALEDRGRFLGIVFSSPKRAFALLPATGGEHTVSLQRYALQPGSRRLAIRGKAQAVTGEAALAAVEEAIVGAGRESAPGGEATLTIVSRLGSVEFAIKPGAIRRRAVAPEAGLGLIQALPRPAPAADRGAASPATPTQHQTWEPPATPGRGDHDDPLAPARAGSLLAALGMLTPDGQLKRSARRKYNQITHLLSLLGEMLASVPRGREMLIVDCGCGKSQLLFAVNHLVTEHLGRRAQLVGIDVDPQAISNAQALQARLGYQNMTFVQSSVRDWPRPAAVDVVLSLHACDVATDEALALGISADAHGIAAVPCCQAEAARQIDNPTVAAALKHGVLRRRLGDWLTDAVRALALEAAGYGVKVLEYVSPLDTPKNLLLLASRDAGPGAPAARRAQTALDDLVAAYGLDPSLPKLIKAHQAQASTS